MRRYLCGVSDGGCFASVIETPLNNKIMRLHPTSEDAFKCKVRELIRQGYTRISSREFSKDNGPILVLTKQSHFGGMLRMGKAGEGIRQTTKRCMWINYPGGIIF